MSQQSEETATEFVVPHLDFIIVAAGNDEGFVEVKVDSADGTIVFLEAIDDGANSIIPPERSEGGGELVSVKRTKQASSDEYSMIGIIFRREGPTTQPADNEKTYN